MANPFRGPQQLQSADDLFGRDDELQELSHMVMARRIVLLYSPSGAGKSSLLLAKNGLLARMRDEPWYLTTWPVARVSGTPEGEVRNRFARSVISAFEECFSDKEERRAELLNLTLPEYAKQRVTEPVLMVFDQFEEILRIDPGDTATKHQFFDELGEMLTDARIWAVFAMREDYLAPLDRYRRLIPTYLESRFRLDLLSANLAQTTIRQTAAASHTISDEALRMLVADLADASGDNGEPAGYVEPLQLQVVCRNLWSGKESTVNGAVGTITEEDVKNSKPGQALATYYSQSVEEAATRSATGKPVREEYRIRRWVEEKLISPSGARNQIPEAEAGLQPAGLATLIESHILRREERHNKIWLELSHDRLVAPVRESNAERIKNLPTYYDHAVKEAVRVSGNSDLLRTEYDIREWIEGSLISSAGATNEVPESEAVPNGASVKDLIESGILRREERDSGKGWLELSHERLVVAVRERNAEWRKGLGDWEKAYYNRSVAEAAKSGGNENPAREEFRIRDWIDEKLISAAGARNKAPESDSGLRPASLATLIACHILRRKERHGTTWLELAYDRLAGPVRESNAEQLQNLPAYYDQAVKEAVAKSGSTTPARTEYEIREWLEGALISPAGAIVSIPEEEAVPNSASVQDLIQSGILRREERDGKGWLELSHKRFVVPVRERNAAWRDDLGEWEKRARAWEHEKQEQTRNSYIVVGKQLRKAIKWVKANPGSRVDPENWLAACRARRSRKRNIKLMWSGLGVAAAVVLGIFAYRAYEHEITVEDADNARNRLEDAELDGDPWALRDSAASALHALQKGDDASLMTVLHTVQAEMGHFDSYCSLDLASPLHPAISPDGSILYAGGGPDNHLARCSKETEWEFVPIVQFDASAEIGRMAAGKDVVAVLTSTDSQNPATRKDKTCAVFAGSHETATMPLCFESPQQTNEVAASPDGNWIAGFGDGGAVLIRVDHGARTAKLIRMPLSGPVYAVAIGSGWLIAGQGRRLTWFHLPVGSEGNVSLAGEADLPESDRVSVSQIAISPDGSQAAIGSTAPYGLVYKMDLTSGQSTGRPIKQPRQFYDDIIGIFYRKDKEIGVVTRRANAQPAIVTLDGQTVLPTPGDFYRPSEPALRSEQRTRAVFSTDGTKAAIITREGLIRMSEVAAKPLRSFAAFPCDTKVTDCAPGERSKEDRCHLSADGTIGLCMVGNQMKELVGKSVKLPEVKPGYDDFALSPRGRYVLIATKETLDRFDLRTGAKLRLAAWQPKGTPVQHEYAISEEGNKLLYDDGNHVYLLDLEGSPKPVPHDHIVSGRQGLFMSMDQAGKVALLGEPSFLRQWDLTDSASDPQDLDAAGLNVRIVKMKPDGRKAALAREDGRVRIINLDTGGWSLARSLRWGALEDDFSVPLDLGERLEDVGFSDTELVGLVRDWSGARRITRTQLDKNQLASDVCNLMPEFRASDGSPCPAFERKAAEIRAKSK